MPRKPRFYMPDVPVHIVQRGNSRRAIFFDDGDFSIYAFSTEMPINYLYKDEELLKITRMVHKIRWYKEQDAFGFQTNYDGFNVIEGAVQLEELEND